MGKRLTQEEFINRAKEIHPEYNYDKSVYVNAKTKVIVTCPIHGDFLATPSSFIMGAKCGCPKCNRGFLKDPLTQDIFIERCKKYFPSYDYSQVIYTGQYNKVIVTCDKHNYTWEVGAKDLMNGHGCPLCGIENSQEKQSLGLEEFLRRAKEIHGDRYDYSKVEYVNFATKVCIICHEHGEFWQRPSNHIGQRQSGCPKCHTQPKGETAIEKYLINKNIEFIQQYQIPYIENAKGTTGIDFYLPDYNTFIEFNGQQHYTPVEHFGGKIKFEKQVNRDNYVRNYCCNNNIKLIEIRYDEDIINVLDNELGS